MLLTIAFGRSVATFPRFAPNLGRFYSNGYAPRKVHHLRSEGQLWTFLRYNSGKISVLEFYVPLYESATKKQWNHLGKKSKPIFNSLSTRFPEVQFGRISAHGCLEFFHSYEIDDMLLCGIFNGGA